VPISHPSARISAASASSVMKNMARPEAWAPARKPKETPAML